MDGYLPAESFDRLAFAPRPDAIDLSRQHSLKTAIGCVGVGVHSGARVELGLHPAPAGHGIVFRRTDLGRDIPARYDHVVDARLATTLGLPGDPAARVGTVEHVMAALSGLGIDNALVTLDGPEVPILDGSAAPFAFLIDCAGSVALDAPRRRIAPRRTIRVEDGEGFAELRPVAAADGLDMRLSIDFAAAAIGRQDIALRLSPASFRAELAAARTFAQANEIAALRAAGLARGGSLENAVVVDGDAVLNPGGLRMEREFARHKLLDAVGDLALAGVELRGRFVAHRSGHALNNRLLRALFADPASWAPADAPVVAVAA
ncbi:MAG: UDP-3-O-acyl-N-acetylglucosamine deacetylase [Rhodospirillales bacterium]|nr:UDP-3-O-acyl-N-acetylglucosamine deacetylase [Rhodospirillales bacterium]